MQITSFQVICTKVHVRGTFCIGLYRSFAIINHIMVPEKKKDIHIYPKEGPLEILKGCEVSKTQKCKRETSVRVNWNFQMGERRLDLIKNHLWIAQGYFLA